MALIAIEAAIRFADQATRDAAIAASIPFQKATRDDEPGCIVYCFAADPIEPDLIQVYELWADAESLAAHFLHPNYFDMRATLGKFGLASAESRKHRIDATAPVYDSDFTARANFD